MYYRRPVFVSEKSLPQKEAAVYVFIGQDSFSKDIKLQNIKKEFSDTKLEDFNLDILYAKELDLKSLQEKLLFLPLEAKRRIVVIRHAQELRSDIKDFILKYARHPYSFLLLILDIDKPLARKDAFLNTISRYARVYYFKETLPPDTFMLSKQINLKKPVSALRVLSQLLKNGEKPERILGGLRYAWQRDNLISNLERKKRLRSLLNCDIDIKTGKIRPEFALERLVISLCSSELSRRSGSF
ncbi:MAG: hypothetical protein NC908_00190 [Candidatus Omnitrophica bacterium]|nr:hypothetical protein [Candidatus Omnitrophota bacterium]